MLRKGMLNKGGDECGVLWRIFTRKQNLSQMAHMSESGFKNMEFRKTKKTVVGRNDGRHPTRRTSLNPVVKTITLGHESYKFPEKLGVIISTAITVRECHHMVELGL